MLMSLAQKGDAEAQKLANHIMRELDMTGVQDKLFEEMQKVVAELNQELIDFTTLKTATASNEEKDQAMKRRQAAFDAIYTNLGNAYVMKDLLVNVALMDPLSLIPQTAKDQYRQEVEQIEQTPGLSYEDRSTKLDAFVAAHPDMKIVRTQDLRKMARATIPLGVSRLIEWKGHIYIAKNIRRNALDHHFGHILEVTDGYGNVYQIPHSMHMQHVRAQQLYYDSSGNVACEATGKRGYITWKYCDNLGFDSQSECKSFVTENNPYPSGHPKLALCAELEKRGQLFTM